MPAPIVVPFNFEPVAVSVRTASYTIPAGRYARVTVNLEGSATFTIGGVTALRGTQNSVLGSSPVGTNSGSGVNSIAVAQSPSTNSGAAFSSATMQQTVTTDIWLPAGTVINGTGVWRATVQEFNKIS